MNKKTLFPETKVSLENLDEDSKIYFAALCWNQLADITMGQLSACPDSVVESLARVRKYTLAVLHEGGLR